MNKRSRSPRKLIALAKRAATHAKLRRTAKAGEHTRMHEVAHPQTLGQASPRCVYAWRVQRPTRSGRASWHTLPRKMSDWRAREYAAAHGLKIGRNMQKVKSSGEIPHDVGARTAHLPARQLHEKEANADKRVTATLWKSRTLK